MRRIMHVDMDAFYASVEQADHPELRGKPVIVGGISRGVVSASSYEARAYGVRSAMPVFQAMRLCPQGILLPVRMRRYREVSGQIMDILSEVSPLVEVVSIDEAFIDVTGTESLLGPPMKLSRSIKATIFENTQLTCSIGVAPNKFLAKIASDMHKPNGLTIVDPEEVPDFLRALPIVRIPGIGPKTSQAMKDLGLTVASDILRFPLTFWTRRLGKHGLGLYEKAQGIDRSPVASHREPKSCSAEDTFQKDTRDISELERWLFRQAEEVGRDLRKNGYRGKTVTLKVKFSDFSSVTRNCTLPEATDCTEVIFKKAAELLSRLGINRSVRLVGVGVSNFCGEMRQRRLFPDAVAVKQENLDRAMDKIQGKFGDKVLSRGRIFEFKP